MKGIAPLPKPGQSNPSLTPPLPQRLDLETFRKGLFKRLLVSTGIAYFFLFVVTSVDFLNRPLSIEEFGPLSSAVFAGILALYIVAAIVEKQGRTRLAAGLLFSSILLVAINNIFGGDRGANIGYLTVAFLSALFFGSRGYYAVVIPSGLLLLVSAFLDASHVLPPNHPQSLFGRAFVFCLVAFGLVGPVAYAFSTLTSALESTLRELADRRKAEQAVREANEFSQQIITSTQEGIIVFDMDLRYRIWNPFMEQFTGVPAQEVLGRHPLELFPSLAEAGVIRNIENALVGGKTEMVDFPLTVRGTDRQVWASHICSPMRNANGEIIGAITNLRDITERKRAEEERDELQAQFQQAQKLEGIGRLAGGVAHDFNNLLTVINGYSELVLSKLTAGDPMMPMIKAINDAGDRAKGLTSQLLAFSRRQTIRPRVIELNAVVEDIQRILDRLIGEDFEMVAVLDPNLGRVVADPDQMHQVLINLIINARDAMPDGGKLTIETQNMELDERSAALHQGFLPGHYVVMTVADSGHGMDAETLKNAFEPFFTTKEQGKGTGLGLSTVYGIVTQSGGWIDVETQIGTGTTFHIYLPRTDDSSLPEQTTVASDAQHDGGTILLVEDEDVVRTFAKSILESCGYTVLEANGGDQAFSVSADFSGEIDLLVTDVILRGINGKKISETLLARRPGMRVLFMSGYPAEVIASRGVLEFGIPYIQKPFTPAEISMKVREILTAANLAPGSSSRI